MNEKEVTVFIYLPGETVAVPAGIFTHHGDPGIGAFAYGQRYVERPNALPVDPIALPFGVAPREVTVPPMVACMGLFAMPHRITGADSLSQRIPGCRRRLFPKSIFCWQPMLHATRVGNLDFRSSSENHEPRLGACPTIRKHKKRQSIENG